MGAGSSHSYSWGWRRGERGHRRGRWLHREVDWGGQLREGDRHVHQARHGGRCCSRKKSVCRGRKREREHRGSLLKQDTNPTSWKL